MERHSVLLKNETLRLDVINCYEGRVWAIKALGEQEFVAINHSQILVHHVDGEPKTIYGRDGDVDIDTGSFIIMDGQIITINNDPDKNNFFLVASLSDTEQKRRVEIDNITQAESIALTRDGKHFALVGKGGINIYTDPDTIVYRIYIDFIATRALFSKDDQYLLIIDQAGNLRRMNWKKKDFKRSFNASEITRACSSSIGEYFAI